MMNEHPPDEEAPLTHTGRERRARMLSDLIDEMRRVHRRRRAGAAGAIAVGAALLVVVATLAPPRSDAPVTVTRASETVGLEVVSGVSHSIRVVSTRDDPPKAVIVRTSPGVAMAEFIDDRALLSELDTIGRPGGLVCMEGRCTLAGTQPDEWRNDAPDEGS